VRHNESGRTLRIELCERIAHDTVEPPAILEVFGQESRAAGTTCALDEKRVPDREMVQAVKIDRRENVLHRNEDPIEPGEELDLPSGNLRGHLKFLGGCREILFENRVGPAIYSARSTCDGSVRMARWAGMMLAAAATMSRVVVARAQEMGSLALMP
jgi:hypothetical protein